MCKWPCCYRGSKIGDMVLKQQFHQYKINCLTKEDLGIDRSNFLDYQTSDIYDSQLSSYISDDQDKNINYSDLSPMLEDVMIYSEHSGICSFEYDCSDIRKKLSK